MFMEVLTITADILIIAACLLFISGLVQFKWGFKVKVVELPHSTLPRKATKGAACFD